MPDDEDVEVPLIHGLFGHTERVLFTQEILQQVVIGLGRLDDVDYEEEEQIDDGDHQPEGGDYKSEGARPAMDLDVSPRPFGPVTPEIQPQPAQGLLNPYFPSIASPQTFPAQQETAQHAKYSAIPWYLPPAATSAALSPATQSSSGGTMGAYYSAVEYPSFPNSTQLLRSSASGLNESIFQLPASARGLGNVPSAMELDYINW